MTAPLAPFTGFGIELEYMLVDAATLDIRPVADRLIAAAGGTPDGDVDRGPIAWSNELALHVLELKTNGPAPTLAGLSEHFHASLLAAEALLDPLAARLLPTALHPWMDPATETRLWPHANGPVYAAYDRIFGCRGHGWSNVQSAHLNLPFDDDESFGRLHAAIRLVLPLLPAIAAASPVEEGRLLAERCRRMVHYRANSSRVPSVTGQLVPERVWSRAAYERDILGRIWSDLTPLDPEGVLREEFANARGAIARFDRMAIEIRVLDLQESPAMDIAVAALATAAVRALYEERTAPLAAQQAVDEGRLLRQFLLCERDAEEALLDDPELLRLWGWEGAAPARAGDVWARLAANHLDLVPGGAEAGPEIAILLAEGSLATRLVRALGAAPDRDRLRAVWGAAAAALRANAPFLPGAAA